MPQTTTTGQDRECGRCHLLKERSAYRQPTHEWCRDCCQEHERVLRGLRRSGIRLGRGRSVDTTGGLQATLARLGYQRPERHQSQDQSNRDQRQFGVEIEFLHNGSAYPARLMQEMRNRGLVVEDWTATRYSSIHQDVTYWKVVTDGSVRGGYELVSPPLRGADGFNQMRLATEALKAAGASVNTTTGLHVHHDADGLTGEQVVNVADMYGARHHLVDMLVAPSRRQTGMGGRSWAKRWTPQAVMNLRRSVQQMGLRSAVAYLDRYMAVNLQAYARHGTLEFRQHQGTLEYRKMEAWVELGQAMVRAVVEDRRPGTNDLRGMLVDLGLTEARVEYHMTRAAALAGAR